MIFCVEDDSSIRSLMLYALTGAGFEAEGFPDGASLFEALAEKKPQLILLDVMLPGEDGISILRKLRAQAPSASIPVIMASAKGTEYDKVIGLDTGADDYLAKPFGMMEMVSRVKAVLRRSGQGDGAKVLCALGLSLNADEHTVSADGKQVELTLKEYKLLLLFMEHPGRVFTRDMLLTKIWEADYMGETRTIDVHVGTLRTKLGKYGDLIRTVRGVGYRMEVSP